MFMMLAIEARGHEILAIEAGYFSSGYRLFLAIKMLPFCSFEGSIAGHNV